MWWSNDPQRSRQERAAFAKLREDNPWLGNVVFKYGDDFELYADVDILHGGETFPLVLYYPAGFPDIPPIVKSRDGKRLSNHQYGPEGEMCLQHRTENWVSSVTGSMMIESAYGLIANERPQHGLAVPVPSAHHDISLGAELRVESWRMTVPPEAWEALAALDVVMPEAVLKIAVDEVIRYPTCVSTLVGIGDNDSVWRSNQPAKAGAVREGGYLLRTRSDMSYLLQHAEWRFDELVDRAPELRQVLPAQGRMHLIVQDVKGRRSSLGVLRKPDGTVHILPFRLVDDAAAARRNASDRAVNSLKRVAVIGCGSIGSKVAVSLARSGVRKFVFVDEDVFMTENLVRNDLDASAIGWHKVEALRERIGGVISDADVGIHKLQLGGEGTAQYLETVLDAIGECDLIVDASADATGFNLCAATAKRLRIPMVWGRVYAGGIGGLVARARPDIDPPPIHARNQIMVWYQDRDAPWLEDSNEDYGAGAVDGASFVADDADVTVVAAHLTRFVLISTES